MYPETAQYLKWDLVSFPEFESQKTTTYLFAHNDYHNVSYQISNGVLDSIKFNEYAISLDIKITPTKEGQFIIIIPTGENDIFKDYCEEHNMNPNTEHVVVLLDNEKVEYELSEIDTDLINLKINYLSDSKLIEIIYACLV